MRTFIIRVHLCIEEGGGHLKILYTKSETIFKKVKHHSKLWRAKIGISYFQ